MHLTHTLILITLTFWPRAAMAQEPAAADASVENVVHAGASDSARTVDTYRQFALDHPGDAKLGEQLFLKDKKLVCANCHRITGAEKAGPNLDGIADKYARRELIEQILRPSLSIKPGYEQTTILLRDGRTLSGRITRAQKSMVKLVDAEGKTIDIQRPDIEEIHESKVSMMPENAVSSISPQQFSDLISYLETLHFAVITGLCGPDDQVKVTRIKEPVRFEPIGPADMKFANPVWCSALPGAPGQLIVLEQQEAKAWRLEPTASGFQRNLFLDLSGQVKYGANWGLLCVAFHPEFKTNRRYFLKYQVEEKPVVKTVVVERLASEDLLRDAGVPSRRLFEVEQPAYNHNGGCLAFGPDGMLYIGYGDGGFQRDPNGNGQNLHDAHGKMLRIDVDRQEGGRAYGIPPDNPFLKAHERDPAILPEMWACGLREPWRFSFDPKTGKLWVGDVGQDRWEEVCLIRAGENHGWNVYEGFERFSDEYRREGEKFTFPLYAYPHSFGVCVTGGYVYRGAKAPSFEGIYIFGDYETRRVWGLKEEAGKVIAVREIGEAPQHIASFGLDDKGEIYVVGYEGTIYRMDLSQSRFE
jgi:putative heme-binding domain-containing protein